MFAWVPHKQHFSRKIPSLTSYIQHSHSHFTMTHCESLLTHGGNHKLCHKCWDHTRCQGNAMHKLVDCIFMRARIYSCAKVSHLIYKSSDDSCHLQNDVPLDHCHYNRPINPDHLQKRRWKWTVHFAAGSLIKIVWKRVVVREPFKNVLAEFVR